MNVPCPLVGALAGQGSVRKGDFKIVVISRFIFFDVFPASIFGFDIVVTLVDPSGVGVAFVARLVGQCSDRGDTDWVCALTNVCDTDGVYKAGKGLLENVFDHIGDRDEHCATNYISIFFFFFNFRWKGGKCLRIEESPDQLDQPVQPLYTLWNRRTKRLASLSSHILPYLFHILFQTSLHKTHSGHEYKCRHGAQDGSVNESKETRAK